MEFSTAATILFILVAAFYGDEKSRLHRSASERVYWPCVCGFAAYTLVLIPDSPAASLGLWNSSGHVADVCIVLLAAFMGVVMHGHSRAQRMTGLDQRLDLVTAGGRPWGPEGVVYRISTSRICDILSQQRTYGGLFAGMFWELWEYLSGKQLAQREKVYRALKDCVDDSPEQLMYLLNSGDVDVPHLLAFAATEDVLALLKANVVHMDVVTKAVLIDALHKQVDFPFSRKLMEPVVDILVHTTDSELTRLKNLVDEGGDFHNLHKLIFEDLEGDFRKAVLRHFRTEANMLLDSRRRRRRYYGGSGAGAGSASGRCKILSDLDDTLYSSDGHFPAGTDRRYPRGEVYPGCLALFREITESMMQGVGANAGGSSRGVRRRTGGELTSPSSSDFDTDTDNPRHRSGAKNTLDVAVALPGDQCMRVTVPANETVGGLQQMVESAVRGYAPGSFDGSSTPTLQVEFGPNSASTHVESNVAFLSARPHAYKDYTESSVYHLFARLRRKRMLHCMPTLLAGKVSSSGKAFLLGAVMQYRAALATTFVFLSVTAVAVGSVFHMGLWLSMLGVFVSLAFITRNVQHVSTVWEAVAVDKAETFREYKKLYPEASAVFFGDNGQGDLYCAETLKMEDNNDDDDYGENDDADDGSMSRSLPYGVGGGVYGNEREGPYGRGGDRSGSGAYSGRTERKQPRLAAAFIHQVIPLDEQLTSLPEHTDADRQSLWRGMNIFFHTTYVGAAVNAFRIGLVSPEGLHRVARAGVDDLIRMRIDHFRSRHPWLANINELNADVERANTALREYGRPELCTKPVPVDKVGKMEDLIKLRTSGSSGAADGGSGSFRFSTLPPRRDIRSNSGGSKGRSSMRVM